MQNNKTLLILEVVKDRDCTRTQIRPHPQPSLQQILTITDNTDVNQHLMNMYHCYFLNIKAGVSFHIVMGMGFERCC